MIVLEGATSPKGGRTGPVGLASAAQWVSCVPGAEEGSGWVGLPGGVRVGPRVLLPSSNGVLCRWYLVCQVGGR